MIKIEFIDGEFVLSDDEKAIIRTKNWRRILREARAVMDSWERELIRRKLI